LTYVIKNNTIYLHYILVTTDGFMTVISTSEQPRDSCELSEFGCCPDGVTAATGFNLEGCYGVNFDNCTYNENENNTGKNNLEIPNKK